jgi:hypothetical protein
MVFLAGGLDRFSGQFVEAGQCPAAIEPTISVAL